MIRRRNATLFRPRFLAAWLALVSAGHRKPTVDFARLCYLGCMHRSCLIFFLLSICSCHLLFTYNGPLVDSRVGEGKINSQSDSLKSQAQASEDFSSSSVDFVTNDSSYGTWKIANGVLEQSICNSKTSVAAFFPSTSWNDFTATVQILRGASSCFGSNEIGLAVRLAQNSGCDTNFYACFVEFSSLATPQIKVNRVITACGSNSGAQTANLSSFSSNTWYTLQAKAIGSKIECSVWQNDPNKAITVTYTDGNTPYFSTGQVGLLTNNALASYDNLKVVEN